MQGCSAALLTALAGVLLVVGGSAAFEAAQLPPGCGKADAFGRDGAGRCLALGFGTELFGHEITPV